jgi:hypothetical protein
MVSLTLLEKKKKKKKKKKKNYLQNDTKKKIPNKSLLQMQDLTFFVVFRA